MISNLIDSLFGCSHKRITFPITIKQGQKQKNGNTATYVVCLDCGGEFAYDWKNMKVMGRRESIVVVPATPVIKAA